MMPKISHATAFLAAFAFVNALPSDLHKRDVIGYMEESADELELKFQPYMDFDTDGCYQTAAIEPHNGGKLNPGRKLGGDVNGHCRNPEQLENSNTYSRRRCNNGVCAILYEYYYEKDQMSNGCAVSTCGHRHDFENVVVFFKQSDHNIVRLAASKHGGYPGENTQTNPSDFKLKDGTHPYIVYNKDGGLTHIHRFASDDDIAHPENYKGEFHRANLVGWNNWPSTDLRDKMNNADWGAASPKTADSNFADALRKAGSADVGLNADGPDE